MRRWLAEFQVEGLVEPRRAPEKARILGGREPEESFGACRGALLVRRMERTAVV